MHTIGVPYNAKITQWKKPLLARVGEAFDKGDKIADDNDQTFLELRAKIGPLTREVDFLEQGLERIHGPRGKSG